MSYISLQGLGQVPPPAPDCVQTAAAVGVAVPFAGAVAGYFIGKAYKQAAIGAVSGTLAAFIVGPSIGKALFPDIAAFLQQDKPTV